MWLKVLRYGPYLLALIAIIAGIAAFASHERRLGSEEQWATDFKAQLPRDMAQAKAADDQLWRTNGDNLHELTGWFIRFNAWARYEAAAAALTDGLAGRVRDAEARLRSCEVPGAGAGVGSEVGGTAGAEGLERLRGLQQAVYDACGRDAAALEALSSREVCECPR